MAKKKYARVHLDFSTSKESHGVIDPFRDVIVGHVQSLIEDILEEAGALGDWKVELSVFKSSKRRPAAGAGE